MRELVSPCVGWLCFVSAHLSLQRRDFSGEIVTGPHAERGRGRSGRHTGQWGRCCQQYFTGALHIRSPRNDACQRHYRSVGHQHLRVHYGAFNPWPRGSCALGHKGVRPFPLFPLAVDGAVYKFDSWLGDEGAVVRVLDRRRFPPPWTVDEQRLCFVVRDQTGRGRAPLFRRRFKPPIGRQIALARQSALDRGQDNETAGTAAPSRLLRLSATVPTACIPGFLSAAAAAFATFTPVRAQYPT